MLPMPVLLPLWPMTNRLIFLSNQKIKLPVALNTSPTFFDDPPVGNASDYTADEFTRTGNVTWDKWAVDLTTIAVVGILAHSLGASSEDAFSMGTTAADQVQTALEEYAPYSGSLDYEDTVTVYDEVSTVTSQYRKHVVIYTLETGEELEPITFYEVRSWV